eukprot:scaffold122535_cov60-Phaeocystis_antarctica.AAC.1
MASSRLGSQQGVEHPRSTVEGRSAAAAERGARGADLVVRWRRVGRLAARECVLARDRADS